MNKTNKTTLRDMIASGKVEIIANDPKVKEAVTNHLSEKLGDEPETVEDKKVRAVITSQIRKVANFKCDRPPDSLVKPAVAAIKRLALDHDQAQFAASWAPVNDWIKEQLVKRNCLQMKKLMTSKHLFFWCAFLTALIPVTLAEGTFFSLAQIFFSVLHRLSIAFPS